MSRDIFALSSVGHALNGFLMDHVPLSTLWIDAI